MKMILEWLQSAERRAMELYLQAAKSTTDGSLGIVFQRLAEDEQMHLDLLNSAERLFSEKGEYPVPEVCLDDVTRNRVDHLFLEFQKHVQDSSLKSKKLLELVVKIESCEWNDIFVYIMDLCSELSPEFQRIPARIETHRKTIDSFLDSLPAELRPAKNLNNLSPLWKRRFLIIDDEEPVLRFLESVFSMHGIADAVHNGEEALGKMRQFYYDVIFSDSDMPFLDGAGLLAKALELDGTIKERFVFCSGNPSEHLLDLCRKDNIRFLPKPVSVERIRSVIREMTEKSL